MDRSARRPDHSTQDGRPVIQLTRRRVVMENVTELQTQNLLQNSPDEAVSDLAKDTLVVAALAKVLSAAIELAAQFSLPKGELFTNTAKTILAASAAKTVVATSRVVEKATGSKGLAVANLLGVEVVKSIGLVKVAGMTPAKAAMYITATVAEKVVAAAKLGTFNKCKMAIASLALSTGTGTLGCVGSLGTVCIIGAIAVAADAFDVIAQCHAE
jgi:hypothetical protein